MVTSRSSWKEPVPEHGIGVPAEVAARHVRAGRSTLPLARIWPLRFAPGRSNRWPSLLVPGRTAAARGCIVLVCWPTAGQPGSPVRRPLAGDRLVERGREHAVVERLVDHLHAARVGDAALGGVVEPHDVVAAGRRARGRRVGEVPVAALGLDAVVLRGDRAREGRAARVGQVCVDRHGARGRDADLRLVGHDPHACSRERALLDAVERLLHEDVGEHGGEEAEVVARDRGAVVGGGRHGGPHLDVVVDRASARGLAEALVVRAAGHGVARHPPAGAARLGRPRPVAGDVDRRDPRVVCRSGRRSRR